MTIMVRALRHADSGKASSDRSGFLWRRAAATDSWQRVFTSIKGDQLTFSKDEKGAHSTVMVSLGGATITEIEDSKPPGRCSRIVQLQLSPSEPEELHNLLPLSVRHQRAEGRQLQLAAQDSSDHSQWTKQLKKASQVHHLRGSVVVEEDRLLNGHSRMITRRLSSSIPLEPSPQVVACLCAADALQIEDLKQGLKRTRQVLKEGVMNIGAAKEEASRSQHALSVFKRQLRQLDHTIAERQADSAWGEDSSAFQDVRDWIERAEHFLKELDARLEGILMKDGPFAPEWVLYGHSTSLRLRGIEEALRTGQAMACGEEGSDSAVNSALSRSSMFAPPTPALPYNGHWKHRVAL